MCGEHAVRSNVMRCAGGSSPHVRGAHFENSIIPRKRKDNWLFFIQFRFESFLAFRYLLALLHPFLGVPTKDPSFASLGRLINCNPSQSTGDQSAPYTLKAICCSFLAEYTALRAICHPLSVDGYQCPNATDNPIEIGRTFHNPESA